MLRICTITLAAILLNLCIYTNAHAQTLERTDWGGIVHISHLHDVNADELKKAQDQIALNIEALIQKGEYHFPDHTKSQTMLGWPMKAKAGYDGYDFYGISYFVDDDPTCPGGVSDYMCGDRTYEGFSSQGCFNHSGTDMFPWPFWWNLMQENAVEIIAAADGYIIGKQDGHYDQNCAGSNGGITNFIALEHADGTRTEYWHLKKNSLTSKNIGDFVSAGEYLAVVGSSGNSSAPHLHFEVFDYNGVGHQNVDPYNGSCQMAQSLWDDQRPYYDPKVNKISSHSAAIDFNFEDNCPQPDVLNESNDFCDGDDVHLYAFFRDMLSDVSVFHRVLDPNGDIYGNPWSTTLTNYDHAAFSYTERKITLPNSPIHGTWKYIVLVNDPNQGIVSYDHSFNVCSANSIGDPASAQAHIDIFPNPAQTTINVNVESQLSFHGWQIRDISGKVLHHEILDFPRKEQLAAFPIEAYSNGLYILSIVNAQGAIIESKRFIKR